MVDNKSTACRIQADAILVSSQQFLAPGQIVISRGRIVEVTAHVNDRPDVLLENCVLLPGLINPHTHLEFSDLRQPLPAGKNFPQWIQNVLAQRQQAALSVEKRTQALTAGLIESRAAGVVVVGDIATTPWQPQLLQPAMLVDYCPTNELIDARSNAALDGHLFQANRWPQVLAFLEQLGLSPERRQAMATWRDQVLGTDRSVWPESLIDLAFSPHAPYSTPPELIDELTQLASLRRQRLAMHVLESPAEREWIDTGTGPMADMLAQFGAVGWRLPADYFQTLCRQLSRSASALLIHGNYLSDTELNTVAQYGQLSLVYCPRTHEHFGHRPYPLASIQQRGIRLLIGTDSRSTNPDLSLWQEAHTALRLHRALRPTQAYSAITDAAAAALGIDSDFGTLQAGRQAALNIARIDGPVQNDFDTLLEQLFHNVKHPMPLESSL